MNPRPIAGSLAVHAAAALVLVHRDAGPRPRQQQAAVRVRAPPSPAPLEVELVELAEAPREEVTYWKTVAKSARAFDSGQRRSGVGRDYPVPPAGARPATETDPSTGTPAPPMSLSMRPGPAADPPLDLRFRGPGIGTPVDSLSARASAVVPGLDFGWSAERDDGEGEGRAELRPGARSTIERPGYRAEVGEDGRVAFHQRGPGVDTPCPSCSARAAVREFQRWSKDPYAYAASGGGLVQPVLMAPGSNERPDAMIFIPLVTGTFDLADMTAGLTGQDYYAADKLRLLNETRTERAGMASAHRGRQLDHVVRDTPRRLRAIWAKAEWSAEKRRALFFQLWDECAETGPAAVVESGDRIRELIVSFIRRHLPPDHAQAYPAAELERLNRRRTSKARFEPYRASPESGCGE